VRFAGYVDIREGVPPVFWPGDTLVVTGVEADGVRQCHLADAQGRPILSISDTVFAEELA